MQSRLMPLPFLLGYGLLWILGLWLALVPHQVQYLWIRLFRTDALVRSRLMLRVIGALWFAFLTFVFWFNLRTYSGK